MADLNVVTVAGRLTRDSEARYSASGTCVLKFSLAVNARKKDASGEWCDEANYFDIVLFGKRAEALQNYLVKGLTLAVTGELRQDRWESDGQSRSRVSILANNVMFMSSSNVTGAHKDSPVQNLQANSEDAEPLQEVPRVPTQTNSDGGNSFEDDIPF